MSVLRWFGRDGARDVSAGRSRAFTLGGVVAITALLGLATALLAIPFRQTRERQLNSAARDHLPQLFEALEAYRAAHYRFPDAAADLGAVGYSPPASIIVCRFRHVSDVRNFDDHVEVALHHRASDRALVARYPSSGTSSEMSVTEACTPARLR